MEANFAYLRSNGFTLNNNYMVKNDVKVSQDGMITVDLTGPKSKILDIYNILNIDNVNQVIERMDFFKLMGDINRQNGFEVVDYYTKTFPNDGFVVQTSSGSGASEQYKILVKFLQHNRVQILYCKPSNDDLYVLGTFNYSQTEDMLQRVRDINYNYKINSHKGEPLPSNRQILQRLEALIDKIGVSASIV